jgi:PKD repeat protein
MFTTPGNYTVTLKITSEFGCIDIKQLPVTIGSIPQPDFVWKDICYGNDVEFMSQTLLTVGNVTSWEWNFGDGSMGTYTNMNDNVVHHYLAPGKYTVTLKVTTNFSCTASVSKEIYILPSVNTYPYFENFETSAGGWVEDGVNVSWQWGMPVGAVINKAASGNYAWATGLGAEYNANEKSFVYSPCFDFTKLQKPMIALKIWNHTQSGFDGAVLQSSVDGGLTWEKVGSVGEGINWYTKTAIIGNPGNQAIGQQGWSGTDSGWLEAKYGLDELKGKSSVRFRIAFGSNTDNPSDQVLNGFAFDDVFVGERDKIVLLEHFTNSANLVANQENLIIDELTSKNNGEVISIEYHTNFPGNDVLNATNMADPSARALYYGVPQTPRTAMDGFIENSKFSEWGMSVLDKRKLATSAFAIDIDLPDNPQQLLTVSAKITSKFNFTDTLVAYIAVVEKEVANAYSGAPLFKNVLRKLLPDAGGIRLIKSWQPGSSETITASWEATHVKDPSQLAVIVFIQNEYTKEIYQTTIKQPDYIPAVITGVEDELNQEEIILYPNPASAFTKVAFKNTLLKDYEWKVYDVLGRMIDYGKAAKGQTHFILNTSRYAEGSYLIQIMNKNKTIVHKRLAVVHNR